ncbi:HEPN domain-containing protein [Synechococcus elongatus]|uniref:ApeA N-terminal domain 1-containing protein n=1 Tax=Synechococcus elongatus TaxID=32046 RepID=UPI0030D35DDD
MANLLNEQKWRGEFFLPASYDQRFFGEISYTPEDGVILSYTVTDNNIPEGENVLYGVLSEGKQCTLFGNFQSHQKSINFNNGLATQSGQARFSFLAIGDFLYEDEKFSRVMFSLTNFQEFFCEKGFLDSVVYTNTPICSIDTEFGKVKIYNSASLKYMSSSIKSHIYSQDPKAISELDLAFQEIKSKYPNAFFTLTQNLRYQVNFEFFPETSIHELHKHIFSFSNLFSLLIYKPVCPESVTIIKSNDDNYSKIEIYPSMMIESGTKDLCVQECSHLLLPINQFSISFNQIISRWFQNPQDESPIISSIQCETGFKTTHTTHGEIILYATQLESISHSEGEKKKKYEYPLFKYGSQEIHEGLKKVFECSEISDVARSISDLRNEIAHVKRPKTWLKKLSLNELANISQYLHLTIIGCILTELGVPKNVIDNYQKKYSPH